MILLYASVFFGKTRANGVVLSVCGRLKAALR